MSGLRWIGVAVLILGLASLVVPFPHSDRHGITVGDVSFGVTTRSDDKIPVAASMVLILSGLAVAVIGFRRSAR